MKTSKIARLPHELREQLNHRLLDQEPAETLLPWLNAQPATKEILAKHFHAQPITPQNLSQWRNGGFAHWQLYHDLVDSLAELALTSGELQKTDPAQLAEAMTTVLMAHYARFLTRWNGDATPADCRRIRLLGAVGRSLHQFRQPAPRVGEAPIQGNPVKPAAPAQPVPALPVLPSPAKVQSIQSNPVKPAPALPPLPYFKPQPSPAKSKVIKVDLAGGLSPLAAPAMPPAILGALPPEQLWSLVDSICSCAPHRNS